MNSNRIILFCLSTIIFSFSSCCKKTTYTQQPDASVSQARSKAGPPVIIYKTKKDYSKQIPVGLTPDKKGLASFPAVTDIYYNGELAYPVVLENGYLLDNRGIGPDVAFLSITYEEYSRLKKTPSADELFKLVIDNEPLTEMYNAGVRYEYDNIVTELNQKIREGKINTFRRLY